MHILHLPRLGQTMQSGVINTWFVEEGSSFEVGVVLYELETDKMTTDVEAKLPGTLVQLVATTGIDLPIGTTLALVADPGEVLTDGDIEQALASERSKVDAGQEPVKVGTTAGSMSDGPTAPSANAVAGGRVRAVPKARALAAELGLKLEQITGTGSGGSITVSDVEKAAAQSGASRDVASVRERRQVQGIARAMAVNVARSWQEVPQFVQQISVDATSLKLQRADGDAQGVRINLTALLIAAVAKAVEQVPEANASFRGEEIVLFSDVNVSVAVATERGLVVPVIRKVQELDVAQIGVAIREVAERAAAGRLDEADMTGGTITLSNLGMFGVETGFPLVNAPQAVIVFAGAVVDRPAAVDDEVRIRPELGLAIGYDHRVLDGATAARFTAALRAAIEAKP